MLDNYANKCIHYPVSARNDLFLYKFVPKSYISVTKASDPSSSSSDSCQLIIKGIKPHQQVDLCTSHSHPNLNLVDTIYLESTAVVNTGPVQVSTCELQ